MQKDVDVKREESQRKGERSTSILIFLLCLRVSSFVVGNKKQLHNAVNGSAEVS